MADTQHFIDMIMMHRKEWEKLLMQAMLPATADNIKRAMRKVLKQSEGLGIIGSFDVSDPRVEEYALNYCAKRVVAITDTSEAQIRKVIYDGVSEGNSIREISTQLLNDPIIGEVATAYRAEMIARTETANAYINGTRLGAEETNRLAQEAQMAQPYTHMVFVASPLCCDICQELDRQISWSMDEDIELPHPNCRCTAEPQLSSSYLE